jgi:hypothetical protein
MAPRTAGRVAPSRRRAGSWPRSEPRPAGQRRPNRPMSSGSRNSAPPRPIIPPSTPTSATAVNAPISECGRSASRLGKSPRNRSRRRRVNAALSERSGTKRRRGRFLRHGFVSAPISRCLASTFNAWRGGESRTPPEREHQRQGENTGQSDPGPGSCWATTDTALGLPP